MNSINWSNFDHMDFTLFCNSLLTFEIGSSYIPFSACGKDGGIDGQYIGEYNNENGKWRFQYKFHKTARKQAFNTLKSELKNEIKNLKDEEHFVLVTNVELLPQELNELLDLYRNNSLETPNRAIFKVWEGAKIHSLYIKYPLLELWIEEGFKTAQLQNYRDYFNKELHLSRFEPGTLSNIFISREKDLEKLKEFLDSISVLALIKGEAGIGKTRLVVEFFERYVQKSNKWIALVLANRSIQVDVLKKVLSSNKNTVILIDDAHNHNPETVSDLKRLAETFNGKVKLILTVRTLQAFEPLKLFKEYEFEGFLKLKLGNLERLDTKKIFDSHLLGTNYRHYINDLVEISYGRPILIVAILKAISEKVSISQIREEGFLKNYVLNYFEIFYTKVCSQAEISPLKLKRLLQNVALIEPFDYTDNSIISQLSYIHNLGASEVKLCLQTLIDFSFVSGRFEQSIKPDYYSDILLLDINKNDASEYISTFSSLLDNIILNLSSIDDVNDKRANVLDEILNKYISSVLLDEKNNPIDFERELILIQRVFTTIGRIVFIRPEIARRSVDIYINCINETSHPIAIEYQNAVDLGYKTAYSSLGKVINILFELNSLPSYYSFVLRSTIRIYELTADKKISSVYAYSKRDVINNYALILQTYFVDEVLNEVKKSDGKNVVFLLEILKHMLSLEFSFTEQSSSSSHSIIITTYYLPASDVIKEFRLKIIDILIKMYNQDFLVDKRTLIFELLLDIPRSIFATERNKKPFIHDEEIEAVLNFLEYYSESFGISAQKKIFDNLYWFIQWNIPQKFIPKIDSIKESLKPRSLAEQLSRVFGKTEIGLKDYNEVLNDFDNKISEIVNNFTPEEIANALYDFLSEQEYQPFYFDEFLRLLVLTSAEDGLIFHDLLLEKEDKIYFQYGGSILSIIYFEKQDNNSYWNRIKKLESLNSSEADNVILNIYGRRVPGKTALNETDIQTILKICNKKNPDNDFPLASGLQSLITASYPDAYTIISDYLDRTNQKAADMFFLWLSDNNVASVELVKNLVINRSIRFYLTHEIERILSKVLEENEPDVIFNYLIARYNFKKKIVEETKSLMGYDFVPDGSYSSLFIGRDEIKENLFFKAIDWYLNEDESGGHLFYGKDIFQYLQPSIFVSDSISEKYSEIMEIHANDIVKLRRIAESLEIFHTKNPQLVALVLKGYSSVIELEIAKGDVQAIQDATYSYYHALTSVGVKSGTVGQPFQVDLDLRDLLMSELKKVPEYIESRKIIVSAIDSINSEINRCSDLDNETW